jgi:hypothetical protein
MSKFIKRWRDGELVYHAENGKVLLDLRDKDQNRSTNIISDDLGTKGVKNPADGKVYDSKSAYYKAVKANGYEIVGNEKLKPKKPAVDNIDWQKAVAETMRERGL